MIRDFFKLHVEHIDRLLEGVRNKTITSDEAHAELVQLSLQAFLFARKAQREAKKLREAEH